MTEPLKRGEVWLANLDFIRVLDKALLIRKLGHLRAETIAQLEAVMLVTLGHEVSR